MAVHVNNPQSTGDPATDRAIRYLTDTSNEYRGHIKRLNDDLGLTRRALVDLQAAFARQQAASAASPASSMSIEQNLGTAAQPQNAGVPFFTSDPPLSHPTSQPTQLIAVGTTPATAALKYWDGTVDPPKLVTLSTGGGGGGSTFQVSSFIGNNTVSSSSSAAQTLAAIAVPTPAGFLNGVGKRFRAIGGGNYGLQSTTPGGTIFTLSVFLVLHPAPGIISSGVLVGIWQFIPPAGIILPAWRTQADVSITAVGVTGSLSATGQASIQVSTVLGTPGQVITDSRVVISGIDLTQAYDVVWTVTFSAQPGSAPFNQCSLFFGSVEFLN